MATKMAKAENTTADKTESKLKKENEQLAEMVKLLQEQIKSLKEMQSVPHTIELTSKMDRPCSIIHLIDCPEGLPTNININGNEYYFSRFGERKLFRFADIQNIVTKYRDWFSRGIFTLGEDCQEFANELSVPPRVCETLSVYNRLGTMPLDEFEGFVSRLAECDREQLVRIFMNKIEKGETAYKNIDKLKVLNKYTNGLLKNYINSITLED